MTRVLITGAGGQLGRDFTALYGDRGEVVPLDRAACDIRDAAAVRRAVTDARPDVVLHTAAFTPVDKAEREPDLAYDTNARGTAHVAAAAAECGAWLVAVSTDYVFSGRLRRPYHEYDLPDPLNVYGLSKLAGEQAAIRATPRATVVRTAWLYGSGDECFPRNIIRLARERHRAGVPLQVVDDQHGTPTSTRVLAGLLADLIENPLPGVVHASCEGVATWHEFAREVLTILGIEVDLCPCATGDVPRPAPRPPYSVLDNMVLRLAGRPPLARWQEELDRWLEENRHELLSL